MFNQRYRRYEEIQNVPDRLRWLRHSRGLIQTEVAARIGMSDHVYKNIEEGITRQITKAMRERLAQFYGVPAMDFIDEFTQFIEDGQANRIRIIRTQTGLTRRAYAELMGIPVRSLEVWENEKKAISYKSWEKYFKGRS